MAAVDVTDADADDPSVERLHTLSELLFQAQSDISGIEQKLAPDAPFPKANELKEIGTKIAVLNGDVDKLQLQVDATSPGSSAARTKRKELTALTAALSERVHALPSQLTRVVTAAADSFKQLGNEHFKAGRYDSAIVQYSEAINVDRKSPVYYSNRSAAYQAKGKWREAAADARESLSRDVSFVKAYLHLIRCCLQLKEPAEAAKALQSAPLALVNNHAELAALSQTVQSEIKQAGNAALKAGQHDAAIQQYSLAISLDAAQPVYFSNRSAVYQAKRMWREAAADAQQAIKLDRLFAKGYLHLAKCQVQMGQHDDARTTLQQGLTRLQEAALPQASYAPLQDLMRTIRAGDGASSASSASAAPPSSPMPGPLPQPPPPPRRRHPPPGAARRAAAFKEQGNAKYKVGDYAAALRCYSQAIGVDNTNGAYYGNRAAAWMMLGKYDKVVEDCAEGLRRETAAGELWKLRTRMATALLQLGKFERAVDGLQEGLHRSGSDSAAAAALQKQLATARELQTAMTVGEGALSEGATTKAKQCFAKLLGGGVTQCAGVLLLASRAHLQASEPIDAARLAQRAIALDADLLPAYVVRAEALHAMGQSEKAIKHLREALQRDPDNAEAGAKLKRLRRLVQDMQKLTDAISRAMGSRLFEEAIGHCSEALKMADGDKRVSAPIFADRAKAYQRLARSRLRGETRKEREAAAAAAGGGGGGGGASGVDGAGSARLPSSDAPPDEDEEDPRAGERACWRRCLQDATSAIYNDAELLQPYLLKAEALQQMERWAEALGVLEACVNSEPSRRSDQQVLQKVAEAQFLVKKAQRPDLYALLGVTGMGCKASEKEIRAAYKKAALECHPDRFSDKGDAERKAAEAKFKELGEALDILTDDFKRKLWDEGHDAESIAQRVAMRDQQQQQQRPR